ncbi:MAG: hypothetical protein IJC56_07510 [Clostridia bacterium]|nr:hypothetical protein [Clostridia bacterium]
MNGENRKPDWDEIARKLQDPELTGKFADDEQGRELKAAMEKLLGELNTLSTNARKLAEKARGGADE